MFCRFSSKVKAQHPTRSYYSHNVYNESYNNEKVDTAQNAWKEALRSETNSQSISTPPMERQGSMEQPSALPSIPQSPIKSPTATRKTIMMGILRPTTSTPHRFSVNQNLSEFEKSPVLLSLDKSSEDNYFGSEAKQRFSDRCK